MENPENKNITKVSVEKKMDRRTFCTSCAGCAAGLILFTYPGVLSRALASAVPDDKTKSKFSKKEIRKIFMQKGSCAHLFFYLLNNEYGHNKNDEERAIDQLAGGIAERGYQCGMLWGTSMGASAEAYRINNDADQAITSAVYTTKQVIEDFTEITGSPDCIDITNIDFSKRFSKLKMIFSAGDCFELAHKWYLKAFKTTDTCLSRKDSCEKNITTCASEVIRKMGGNEEQMVMVSGFAGGLGLSGNGCGALSAAIWMKTLDWCRKDPERVGYSYSGVQNIMTIFEEATRGEMLCHKITGKKFISVDDHSEFVKNGGCEKLINLLAETKTSVS